MSLHPLGLTIIPPFQPKLWRERERRKRKKERKREQNYQDRERKNVQKRNVYTYANICCEREKKERERVCISWFQPFFCHFNQSFGEKEREEKERKRGRERESVCERVRDEIVLPL